MALTTIIEMRKEYLFVLLEGAFELSSSLMVNEAILESVEKYQATRVLVDFRGVTGNLEPMERYQYANAFSEKYWLLLNAKRIKRCHFVFLGNFPQLDRDKFDENVAVNRGLSMRTTNDPKQAFEWIGAEPGS